jgi:hypothetical protein
MTESVRPPASASRGRRVALALAVGLAGALAAVLLLRSAGDQPPAAGAARLVPADALLYLHVSTDRDRDGVERALELANRFPGAPALRDGLLRRLAAGGQPVSYDRDLRPWIGDEAAVALLNTSGQVAGSLVIVSVRDDRRARRFLRRAAGTGNDVRYGKRTITRYGNVATSFIGSYLAIGQEPTLRQAIEREAGRSPSLQREGTFRRAMRDLPEGRAADAYASAAGVRRLLAPQGGPLGVMGTLLDRPAVAGVGFSLTADDEGARIRIRQALDERVARRSRRLFQPFEPRLLDEVPSDALGYIGISGLDRAAGRLLTAGSSAGATGRRLDRFVRRASGELVRRAGVNLERDIQPLFRSEVALWLTAAVPAPRLTLITPARDERRTTEAFSRLQAPLARLFTPPGVGPGQAPVFRETEVDGSRAWRLQLGPGVEIDYAVFDRKLVISTSLDGIRKVKRPGTSLEDARPFRRALGDHPKRVTSLVFLDFRQLLGLGERTGLRQSSAYQTVREDLRQVRTIGVATSGGEKETNTELFLEIS